MPDDRPTNPNEELRRRATDVFHVSLGAGLLGFQRLQVERRRLESRLADVGGPVGDLASGGTRAVMETLADYGAQAVAVLPDGGPLAAVAAEVERTVDRVLDGVEQVAPDGVARAIGQGRAGADDLRRKLTTVLGLDLHRFPDPVDR